ncbi:MAG: hypothetical protein ThorAB25_11210 [Candidatus Thorarchaeota archaeon AB_25]|nr:MAG: hypothetical protein ThorAB25_11210 [Candidatus Thorarchaeota archaeon AB_25]
MSGKLDISELVKILISIAYPELQRLEVLPYWGRTSCFAQIRWDDAKNQISIRFNKNVKKWHEAGIIGLVSHELSHPAQKGAGLSELETDRDAISRGFGPYLAIERVYTGKFEDHLIRRGKDRYLGYRSIRAQLTQLERQQLDMLLSQIGLIPAKPSRPITMSHDVAIVDRKTGTTLMIEGHKFLIPENIRNPDIKLLERDCVTYVYADNILLGEFREEI